MLDLEIAIQDKNDMPFEKKVELENGDWGKESGVNVGDTLNFRITGKVPALDADQTSYFYLVNDYLTGGLDLVPDSVVVTIGAQTITLDPIYDPAAELTGNQIRYNYIDENDPATPDDPSDDRLCGFDLSLDMIEMNEEGLAGEDRLLVRGHRIETPETVEEEVKAKVEEAQIKTGEPFYIALAVAVGLLILIIILVLVRAIARKKAKNRAEQINAADAYETPKKN